MLQERKDVLTPFFVSMVTCYGVALLELFQFLNVWWIFRPNYRNSRITVFHQLMLTSNNNQCFLLNISTNQKIIPFFWFFFFFYFENTLGKYIILIKLRFQKENKFLIRNSLVKNLWKNIGWNIQNKTWIIIWCEH
jgi:hypothetical protein